MSEVSIQGEKILELNDKIYHLSRSNEELKYLHAQEIKELNAKIQMAIEALKKVDHNGCCLVCSSNCPSCNASSVLRKLDPTEVG